jgi:hypothetical protein
LNAGVAGGAASRATVQSNVRAMQMPSVNHAGCYTVLGQSGLPSTLSLDNTRFGVEQKVAALAGQRALHFSLSAFDEANERKTERGWWEPIEGGRFGVRISIDNRLPMVFTPSGDSLVSAPDSAARTSAVTLRRVNCPIR